MDNELKEILGTILDKIENLDTRLENLENGQENLENGQKHLEKELENINTRLDVVELKQDLTHQKLDSVTLDLAILKRNSEREFKILKDADDTIIEVLRQNELLPH